MTGRTIRILNQMREESRQEARTILKTLVTTAALRGVRVPEQDMKKFLRWVDEGFLTKRILKVIMHGYRARGKRARELARALEGRAYGLPLGHQHGSRAYIEGDKIPEEFADLIG